MFLIWNSKNKLWSYFLHSDPPSWLGDTVLCKKNEQNRCILSDVFKKRLSFCFGLGSAKQTKPAKAGKAAEVFKSLKWSISLSLHPTAF